MADINKVRSHGIETYVVAILLLLSGQGSVFASDGVYELNIPGLSAAEALDTLAKDTGHSLFYLAEDLSNVESNALDGSYTLPEALSALLDGTHLNAVVTEKDVIVVSITSALQQPKSNEGSDMNKQQKKVSVLASIGAFLSATAPVSAIAQTVASPGELTLDEIVVTAQKREQNLQDIPVSVFVVDGASIRAGGFSDMEDMSVFIPNLHMIDNIIGQQISIRGIGTEPGNEAFEQAVAQFHDGVYYGRDNLGQNTLYDIQQVEVVRGPAPVFAGQSATAGALSYVSRRPGDQWEANIVAAFGDNEETSIEGAFGGPLTDNFGFRVAGRYYELNETGYTDAITGEGLGIKENSSVRVIGVWEPTENFDVTFKYEYQDVWQRGTPGEYLRCETRPEFSIANAGLAPGVPAVCALEAAMNGVDLTREDGVIGSGGSLDIREVMDALNAAIPPGDPLWGENSNPRGRPPVPYDLNLISEFNEKEDREHDADIGMLAFNWDIGGSGTVLTATSGFLQFDKHDWLDVDHSSFALFMDERNESFDQFSQEVRIASPADRRFAWMVGGYYQDHDLVGSIRLYLPGGVSFGGPLTENSTWKSLFFNTTYNFNDSFRLNVGARYQDIEKDGTLVRQAAFLAPGATSFGDLGAPSGSVSSTANASDTLPEVSVQWDAGDNVMLYAKYAEALKAGGFVLSAPLGPLASPDAFTYEPERAEGYELGVKALLVDGRLQINAAYYDTDFSDLQVTIFNGVSFVTDNAAKAHTRGIEIDGRFAVSENFDFGFAISNGEAEYDDYPGGRCNTLDGKLSGNPRTCRIDLAGATLQNAPDWAISVSPEYRFLIGNLQASAGVRAVASDGYVYSTDRDPLSAAPAWERVDLRFSLTSPDGNWEAAIYGRNITDDRPIVAGTGSLLNQTLDQTEYDADGYARLPGKRWGVQLSYSFGQ